MTNTLIHLTDHGLLRINGIDAKKLLQGQLTCDVEKIPATVSCLAAHCNPQGRIISLFRLFQFHNAYYLLMPRSMIQIAMTALKKYAVFYKTDIVDASDELVIVGYAGPTDDIALTNDMNILQVSPHLSRHILVGQPERIKTLCEQLSKQAQIANINTWKCFDINDGIPAIYPETSGKFLPHEINLHELNAISFEKGCYTGQEIIARMHYRGKLKNHMYRADIRNKSYPAPGQDIYCLHDEKIQTSGTVVDSCQTADNHDYQTLIMIDKSNAKNNYLFLNQNDKNFFTLEI